MSAAAPRYHATEAGRWDYRVTIVFRDVAAAFSPGPNDAELRRLFPDQEMRRVDFSAGPCSVR